MSKNKLQKFAQNAARWNVIEPGKPLYETIKGCWGEHFQNDHPLVLELACGRGEYSVGLGRAFPNRNFIGIDIKGARIWKGSGIAEEESLQNVSFLRTHVLELHNFFQQDEVEEIWIVHPDPRPKKSDIRRRITNPRYLEIYKSIIKPGGMIRLKTDNDLLFQYSLEVLNERDDVVDMEFTRDLHNSDLLADHHGIKTRYEEMALEKGDNINYLKFRFTR